MHYKRLILNGLVFDGPGASRNADIVILEGKIAIIGKFSSATAEREIDANSLWVSPEFTRPNTHYALGTGIAPAIEESLRHGVSIVIRIESFGAV
jgi:N-acyl-D-glutamate deacylase